MSSGQHWLNNWLDFTLTIHYHSFPNIVGGGMGGGHKLKGQLEGLKLMICYSLDLDRDG